MFHSRQFRAPVMSLFFCPHEPYVDVTLDDVHPRFHPPRYPTNGESDSDTWLTPTISVESNPLKSSYPTYSVESDPSEPSYPSVTSNSSASSTGLAPPLVRGCGFIRTRAVPRGRGNSRGGGHGNDASGGFVNGYLPFNG